MNIAPLDRYERMPLSESTRTLLLHFATSDEERSLPHVKADWEEVLEATGRHGLVPLAWRLLRHQALDNYPPQEFMTEIKHRYRASTVRSLLMYRRVLKLLEVLTRRGLDFIVLKGPALGTTVYPDPSLRVFNDLDLLVRERDWAAADEILRDLGFIPEQDLPEPPPKLIPEAVLYELNYHSIHDGFIVEVHYNDVLQVGLAARDVEGFWQRATLANIEDLAFRILSIEDQIIHLCAHMHCHIYTRLNWFSDLAFILRQWRGEIEWEKLVSIAEKEGVRVPVYYGLRYLDKLLEVSPPSQVLQALRPDEFRCKAHEILMPEEKVLSIQPMSRQPIFSFYFHPFLGRLLPDLLVMGRRWDKLQYLFRLLIPPREWLGYYYSVDGSEPIIVHYVLHPLKLVYHIVTELLQAISDAVLT